MAKKVMIEKFERLVLLMPALLLAFNSVAQDSLRRRTFGLELAAARPGQFMGAVLPSLTWSAGKHVIAGGPAITYFSAGYPQPFLGGQAGYQLYPNGRKNRFDLLFEFQVIYARGILQDNYQRARHLFFPGPVQRTIKFVALDNYFGFGFRFNMSARFFLKANYGISLGFYKEDYKYVFANGGEYSGGGEFFPGGMSLSNRIFKLGIGYDLPARQR